MDEILKPLLESELLSEDTKRQLSEQLSKWTADYKKKIHEEVSMEVRQEIKEAWDVEREALIDQLSDFITEELNNELTQLKGDIESFRDLEAEAAKNHVELKHQMANQLEEEFDDLVTKLSDFLDIQLEAEIQDLKEDLQIVKQNEFGRKIFEAFAKEFNTAHVDEDSITAKLQSAELKLEEAKQQIKKLEESAAVSNRVAVLEKVLAPLSGKKREQMEFVLKSVETDRLQEAYDTFIGRILKEDIKVEPKKPVITESKKPVETQSAKSQVVTGNPVIVTEDVSVDPEIAKIRRLGGV